MRGLRIAAVGVAALTVVLLGIGVAQELGLLSAPADDVPGWVVPVAIVAILGPTTVGLLIALRRPRTVIAWILLAGALSQTTWTVDLLLSDGWGLQIGRATWPLIYAWPIAVAYVFPNGRLLSRRWRGVAGAAAISFVAFMSIGLLDPRAFDGDDASVPNPLAGNRVGEWLVGNGVWIPFYVGILASLICGAFALWLRLRRSSGIERLQMLWLAWSASLIPLALLLCISAWAITDVLWILLFPFLLVMQAAVAGSIGIAVTRYRLYEIERLINRTLVYVALTVALLLTYAAVTLALGLLAGRGSAWVTAVATLAVAAAFRPLRARLQDLVDRRFSRARYQGVRRIRAFEDEVRDGRRAPEEIGRIVAEALGDPLADLCFWLPATGSFADPSGEVMAELPADGRARSEVRRDEALTAALLHDPGLLDRPELLHGVLAAASLSIEIARLRVDLRLQLAEVEASRTRIVEAGYEERRRLERDLHDGAQQRLVSLGVRIRRIQGTLPTGARVLSPALDQIVDEVGAAIRDLRQIAAGVRPARLDDGLAAALRDLARSSPIPVDIDVPAERYAPSIEAAAYFVACEALTNAVKHASPSKVAVRAVRANGDLHVSVSDDGIGGAVLRRGSGLAGLRDRIAAHGGTLDVVSPRGGGTRIEVAIPCAS